MEVEPDGVIGVEVVGQTIGFAGHDPFQVGGEPVPVGAEAGEPATEGFEDALGGAVQLDETVDHAGVVVGVAVVVEDRRSGHRQHLPVRADLEQLRIEAKELAVGRFDVAAGVGCLELGEHPVGVGDPTLVGESPTTEHSLETRQETPLGERPKCCQRMARIETGHRGHPILTCEPDASDGVQHPELVGCRWS